MLEKEVRDLQTRNNQHRLELNDLAAQIAELKILMSECSRKCELISRFDVFMFDQKKRNESLAGDMKSVFDFMKADYQRGDQHALDLHDLKKLTASHQELVTLTFGAINECREKFESQELPNRIDQLKQELENHKLSMTLKFQEIDAELCVPFTEVIAKYVDAQTASQKAQEDSAEARKVAERIGVEIKVLNRKMNDIVEKLK